MNKKVDEIPQITRSEEVFRGRVFSVTRDEVRERADETFVREIVAHPGSACILPLFSDNTIALVRQYRHPAREFLLEIPAGGRAEGEPPETCAHRELEEEIGVVANQMELLAEFYPSPGFLAEKMWVYLATDLRESKQNLDADEEVEIVRFSVAEATAMIARGEIKDAKTIIALLMLAKREVQTGATAES